MTPEAVTNVRAQIGEGPSGTSKKNVLYWVDITGGVVYAHTPNKPYDEVIQSVKDVACGAKEGRRAGTDLPARVFRA